jgi:hypothetical protein
VLFPLAYMATTSALTLLLIGVGLLGETALAADLAIAQGAVIATFFAFSANARNLLLQGEQPPPLDDLVLARLLLLAPLALLACFLSVGAADVSPSLAGAVILRRASEWLNELHLSKMERDGDRCGASAGLSVQGVALVVVIGALVAMPEAFLPLLWIWALTPLAGSIRLLAALRRASLARLRSALWLLTPHIGSTAIVGVSIYLLRLIIVLVTDRHFAGVLFTAVAIGSFSGSVFANVLGPSLALKAGSRTRGLRLAIGGLAVTGILLALGSTSLAASALGQSTFFWSATGLSLLGSAVMVHAQRFRLLLFQSARGDALFGPDVIRTLTLVIAAPAFAVVIGWEMLAGVYLLDAVLTWAVYAGAYRHARASSWLPQPAENWLLGAVGAMLIVPIFIQLKGAVYHSPAQPMLDSGGRILNLPLPLSLAASFAGTLLLARFEQARNSMVVVFFLFFSMALTSVIATGGQIDYGSRKLLLLLQFLLPVFALALGQMVGHERRQYENLPKIFLYVLLTFVPVQLGLTWARGQDVLTHDMVFFSIYQHRQYVPVVFVSAYLVALFSLWKHSAQRLVLLALGALISVYAVMSYSTLALALLMLGAGVLVARTLKPAQAVAVFLCMAAGAAAMLWAQRNTLDFLQKYRPMEFVQRHPEAGPLGGAEGAPDVSASVSRRLGDWKIHGRGIMEAPEEFFFGHGEALDRAVTTSAHNYYLDFLYNFGAVGFLPLLLLICYTVVLVWRQKSAVLGDLGLLGLTLVVLFLVLIDSNFKVTLRQPYPGVFTFFLWGLLLAKLSRLRR